MFNKIDISGLEEIFSIKSVDEFISIFLLSIMIDETTSFSLTHDCSAIDHLTGKSITHFSFFINQDLSACSMFGIIFVGMSVSITVLTLIGFTPNIKSIEKITHASKKFINTHASKITD